MCYEGSCTEGTNDYYCSNCWNRDDSEGKTHCDECGWPLYEEDAEFNDEVRGFADLFRKD